MGNDEATIQEEFLSVLEVTPLTGVIKSKNGAVRPAFFLKVLSLDGHDREKESEHLFEMTPMDALRIFAHLTSVAMTYVDDQLASVVDEAKASHPAPSPYM